MKDGDIVKCVDDYDRDDLKNGNYYKIESEAGSRKFYRLEGIEVCVCRSRVKLVSVPNNALSRMLYPKYIISKCTNFLIPEKI